MLQVRFLPPAAKFIKKLKDKKLKNFYKENIEERICFLRCALGRSGELFLCKFIF